MNTETKKVLILDDDSDMRIFLSNLLEADGFSPVIAENSHEGLLKAMKERPDLIILDVPMPEKKGIQIHQDLKHDKRFKDIPVIMISPLDKKTLQQYQRTIKGYNDQDMPSPEAYLKKPLEAEELLALVRKFVTRKT
ncbi:MAG: response regulator, partial [Deltaproteobacteria bacterium]|nr:response regulator [Deltaproteobacteria bacterium]